MNKYLMVAGGLILVVVCIVNAAAWMPYGLIGNLFGGFLIGKGLAKFWL